MLRKIRVLGSKTKRFADTFDSLLLNTDGMNGKTADSLT